MPLIVSGIPSAACLPPSPPLRASMEAIPRLMGAWAAEDFPQEGAWPARYGDGVLTNLRRPHRGQHDGRAGVIFAGEQVCSLAGGVDPNAPLTVAMRLLLTSPGKDIQYLFGHFSFHSVYRTNPPRRVVGVGATSYPTVNYSASGWTTLILQQAAGQLTIEVDGMRATGDEARAGISSLYIGAYNTAASNGLIGVVRSVLIAQSGLIGSEHEAAMRAWVA